MPQCVFRPAKQMQILSHCLTQVGRIGVKRSFGPLLGVHLGQLQESSCQSWGSIWWLLSSLKIMASGVHKAGGSPVQDGFYFNSAFGCNIGTKHKTGSQVQESFSGLRILVLDLLGQFDSFLQWTGFELKLGELLPAAGFFGDPVARQAEWDLTVFNKISLRTHCFIFRCLVFRARDPDDKLSCSIGLYTNISGIKWVKFL